MNDRFGRVEDGRGSLGHSATLRFPSHLCRFGICSRKRLRIAESGPTLCLTYALLKMKPRPAFNGLSIGYRAKDFELHKSGSGPNGAKRTLKAVDLVECSLVTFPADKFARVASVKSGFDIEPVDEAMSMKDFAMMEFEMLRRTMCRHN